jgi:hypothetical protein
MLQMPAPAAKKRTQNYMAHMWTLVLQFDEGIAPRFPTFGSTMLVVRPPRKCVLA